MSATMLQYGLDKLSADERLALADELYDSVNLDDEPESPEVLAMLRERIARIDSELAQGIDSGIPWEEVGTKAEAIFRKR